jgi:hypothetical protein
MKRCSKKQIINRKSFNKKNQKEKRMGWPPAWGYIFWNYIHASAKSYEGIDIPPETSKQIKIFLEKTCRLLPCPACSLHCVKHVSQHQPFFETGENFWKYTVDFHNTVNKRTGKIEFSYEEADMQANLRLKPYDLSTKDMPRAFLQEYWNVLLHTTFTVSQTPDSFTQVEKDTLLEYLKASCYTVPFSMFEIENNDDEKRLTIRHEMLAYLNVDENLDFSTRDKAFLTVTNLHNSVCKHFHVFPRTSEEMKTLFMASYENKNYIELVRAHQIREEDHAKMLDLQKELKDLRHYKGVGEFSHRQEQTPEKNEPVTKGVGEFSHRQEQTPEKNEPVNFQTEGGDNDGNIRSTILGVLLSLVVFLAVVLLVYKIKYSSKVNKKEKEGLRVVPDDKNFEYVL